MKFEESTVNVKAKLVEVVEKLSAKVGSGRVGRFLVVVDHGNVVGVISDSDIRNNLTNSKLIDQNVSSIMRTNFLYLKDELSKNEQISDFIEQLKGRTLSTPFPIEFIPTINAQKQLTNIQHFSEIIDDLRDELNQVVVIGLGFVGLTFALCLSQLGFEVIGIETSIKIREGLEQGQLHILEPGASEILENNYGKNFRVFSEIEFSEVERTFLFGPRTFIVAVGTPIINGKPNLESIESAIQLVAKDLKKSDLIIVRSTVPVGTCRNLIIGLITELTGLKPGIDYFLTFCPERTVEGNALLELVELPQIIGGFSKNCAEQATAFFAKFSKMTVLVENLETAEMAKLMSNSYRDTMFGFSNEMAIIASQFDIDINQLISTSNLGYYRNNIAKPSPGVGGPCLSKDSYLLLNSLINLPKNSVIKSARTINEKMPKFVVDQILKHINANEVVLICGVAFKGDPPTNDFRGSPALDIIAMLSKKGCEVYVLDAEIDQESLKKLNLTIFTADSAKKIAGILILNNHRANVDLCLSALKYHSDTLVLFDPWKIATRLYSDSRIRKVINMSKVISVRE
jgi:UDP-N-acetyl-D-mannosaminuronic acid dehydrogenase